MNSCPDGEANQKRPTFVHKQTKANRFDPKPPRKNQQQKFNSNNKKFDKQNKGGNFNKNNQGNKFNDSSANRRNHSSSDADRRSVKRSSDQFQQDDFEDPPKTKVFKRPA